jgi:hypothetical protein
MLNPSNVLAYRWHDWPIDSLVRIESQIERRLRAAHVRVARLRNWPEHFPALDEHARLDARRINRSWTGRCLDCSEVIGVNEDDRGHDLTLRNSASSLLIAPNAIASASVNMMRFMVRSPGD